MSNELELIEPDDAKPRAVVSVPEAASPDQLITMAVRQGADMAYIRELVQLRRELKVDAAKEAFAAAFAGFRDEAVRVQKNKMRTQGPLTGQAYADLSAFILAATPALSKHGLGVRHEISRDDADSLEVTCLMTHALGHVERVTLSGPIDTGPGRNTIQARESTVTYLKRSTFKLITGMSEEGDDDDGLKSQALEKAEQAKADLLADLQAAAILGEEKLRECYDKHNPADAWWAKHDKALKATARAADAQRRARTSDVHDYEEAFRDRP